MKILGIKKMVDYSFINGYLLQQNKQTTVWAGRQCRSLNAWKILILHNANNIPLGRTFWTGPGLVL